MADIELVIKIPKDIIEGAKSSPNYYPTYLFEKIWRAIANGTPLPKGHGELIDKGKFKKWIETQDGDKLMTEYYLDALDMQETIVGGEIDEICDAITNGVQLPEGHGRLSDLDKIWPNF